MTLHFGVRAGKNQCSSEMSARHLLELDTCFSRPQAKRSERGTGYYPLRCYQRCTGPCTPKRTFSANHGVQIHDSWRLIRCNFAVYLITEVQRWQQRNGCTLYLFRLFRAVPLNTSFQTYNTHSQGEWNHSGDVKSGLMSFCAARQRRKGPSYGTA